MDCDEKEKRQREIETRARERDRLRDFRQGHIVEFQPEFYYVRREGGAPETCDRVI